MHLSTKSRYGTRAVLDIALHCHQGPVTLNDISCRQGISKKYLGQIVNQLLAAGILESIRGPRGGYVLGRPPQRTKVGEIIRILDGSMAPVRCVDKPKTCNRNAKCATREIWIQIKESVEAVVNDVTVADLVTRQKEIDGLLS
jgi:Rrf2 family protein